MEANLRFICLLFVSFGRRSRQRYVRTRNTGTHALRGCARYKGIGEKEDKQKA